MKKRILSLLLCCALVFCLLPTAALAEDAIPYDLWVNGEQFTSEKLMISCGDGYVMGGTLAYDPIDGNNAYACENVDIDSTQRAQAAILQRFCETVVN